MSIHAIRPYAEPLFGQPESSHAATNVSVSPELIDAYWDDVTERVEYLIRYLRRGVTPRH